MDISSNPDDNIVCKYNDNNTLQNMNKRSKLEGGKRIEGRQAIVMCVILSLSLYDIVPCSCVQSTSLLIL